MKKGSFQTHHWRTWLSLFVAMLSCCAGCTTGSSEAPGVVASWTYPIRLGDARAKAHELLGNPTRSTEVLEEYPLSGITLWFDSEGRVSKVNLQGTASALYTGGAVSLLSHRALAFGLTAHSRDGDFARILGMPVTEIQEGPSERRERSDACGGKSGYLIDATFLGVDRAYGEKRIREANFCGSKCLMASERCLSGAQAA